MITYPTFKIFTLKFQTWGSFFALAALASFFLLTFLAKKKNKNLDLIYNIFFLGFFAGIIGARAFYFLVHPHPLSLTEFLYFWQGGYILFGGAIFAVLAVIIYLIYKKQNISNYLNLLTIPTLLAILLIRVGSLLVLDNIGKITNLAWGIQFLGQNRHPVDAYYLILDLILLGFAIYLFKKENSKLFFIILFGFACGRLIIHFSTSFVNSWDANLNLIFWSLTLIISLIGFKYLKNTNK